MTVTDRPTAARAPIDSMRRIARAAGVYAPVKERDYATGPDPDTAVVVGGVLEMVVALLYRARLAPRILPPFVLVGAPLLVASTTATMFGSNEMGSAWSVVAALPIALWVLSLGIWLVAKGFTPSPIIAGMTVPVSGRPG